MNLKHKFIGLFLTKKSKTECHQILHKWNSYYQGLSQNNKNSFVVRTLMFLRTTDFDSKKDFELTTEMKLVISSAFVQITFGLKQDVLDIFNHIFVAPSSYSYRKGGPLFDGDVNPKAKRINLSWPAVEQGFEINDDGLNLAIHEFGHSLLIENFRRSFLRRIFNERRLQVWKKIALEKIPIIREGNHKLFREYGGRNLMELFSITLENFFELPHEFYSYSPQFYRATAILLKQDPRNRTNPKVLKN